MNQAHDPDENGKYLVTWWRRGQAAYVNVGTPDETGPRLSVEQRELEPGLIVDYAEGGAILGLEILNPRSTSFATAFAILEGAVDSRSECSTHTPYCAACGKREPLVLEPGPGKASFAKRPDHWRELVDDHGLHVVCSIACAEDLLLG